MPKSRFDFIILYVLRPVYIELRKTDSVNTNFLVITSVHTSEQETKIE